MGLTKFTSGNAYEKRITVDGEEMLVKKQISIIAKNDILNNFEIALISNDAKRYIIPANVIVISDDEYCELGYNR